MEITRGDNKTFKFQRKRKDGSIITDLPSKMFVTIKKDYSRFDFVIQKSLENKEITYNDTDNFYRFELVPEDTNDLLYGNYVYDIEITENSKVKTISKGKFTITEEATFESNKQ